MMRLNPGTAAKAMVLCILFALPPAALAQDSTLTGTITDSTDAALPGVAVTATHVASGNTFVGTSDSGGQYRVGPVRPGVYRIRAELQGFTTMTLENLEVLVGQRLVANVKLTISSVQESVTVTGETPLVDVSQTRPSGNIDPRQVSELPVLGRNWMDLSMLAPGSRANAVDESPVGGLGGSDTKNFQLNFDGQSVTNIVSAGGFQPRYSRDLIAEFEMVNNRFDASQGRSMAGQVNVITKSGTNRYGGSLSGYFRDDKFNAMDFIVGRVLPYQDQQISATFGGPIKKDRIHIFANYEWERNPQSYTFTSPFPRFNFDLTGSRKEKLGGVRVDNQFTNNTRLMVRGHAWKSFTPNDPRSTGGATLHPTRSATVDKSSHEVFATYTQVMRPDLIHEIKGGYNFMNFRVESIVPHSVQVLLRGYSIGEQSNQMHDVDQDTWQIRDDWTWLRGRHEIKMGGEAIHNTTCICPWQLWMDGGLNATGGPVPANIQDLFPVWNDPSTWNLKALSPITVSWEQSVADSYFFKDPRKMFAAYAQDNWTVTKKLTLNFGLRYDLCIGCLAEGVVVEPFLPARTAPRPSEKRRFVPRLGLGYKVSDKTVIRGGFGKYYGELNDNPTHSTQLSAQAIKVFVFNDLRPDFASNPFNGPVPTPAQAKLLPGRSLVSNIVNPDTNLYGMPYSWQSSIGVQQQLTQTMGVQVDYNYMGKRRDEASYESNLSYNVATGANYTFSDVSKRPYPTFGNVGVRVSDGWSNQHSIDTGLTKRLSKNWQASATYSLSWLRDGEPIPRWPCFVSGAFVPCPDGFTVARDVGGEYGLSVGDQRHRAVFNGIWQLPYGFRLSGLYFFGSGQRLATVFGQDVRGRALTTGRLRPDGTIVTRNNFVGTPLHRVDTRLAKQFRIAGNVKIEGLLEVFNLFNHENYGSWVTNESSASYGKPQQNTNVAYQPRMMQLGFRFEF